ncbi:hypothetical protein FHS92_002703 [Sphingobium subterraneum]|uniref:Uncharacterized protein n=1 Tax=Sphingobium subterraneum TaxID=627688 RepID=A0A841J2Q6_9SPHN|nr:hypothetical protein [Sphingobium subterraneum]
MHKCVGLAIIALNEPEALHRIEEFDCAARALTGQLTLRTTIATGTAETTRSPWLTRRAAIGHGQGLAFNLEIRRGNLTAPINEGETQRLPLGKTGQTRLFDRADVHEHIFRAIIANDKAEALLTVKEFYDASAFPDDLRRHAPTCAATATAEATTTGTATAETAAITETARRSAKTATVAPTEAASVAEPTAKTAASRLIWKTAKIVAAETVPLVLAASAATSIKTHALLVTFASSTTVPDEHVGRRDMQNPPYYTVWESL